MTVGRVVGGHGMMDDGSVGSTAHVLAVAGRREQLTSLVNYLNL